VMDRKEQILMSAFVAVESAHAYSAVLPSIFTIREFVSTPAGVKAIRDGEIIGTLFAVALGGIVSALTENRLPLYFSMGTSVIMVSIYEYALRGRSDRSLEREIEKQLATQRALPIGGGRIVEMIPAA
jgi:hypothetical protein